MKIKILKDEISFIKTIPFVVQISGQKYKGVLIQHELSVGGYPVFDYKIEWENDKEPPDLDKNELIDKIMQQEEQE